MKPLFKIGQEVQVNNTALIEYILDHNLTTKGKIVSINYFKNTAEISINNYNVDFGNGYILPIVGADLLDVTEFNSQAEVWEYLLSGGKVSSNSGILLIKNGKLHNIYSDGIARPWVSSLHRYNKYTKYTEPAKWYDNIPKEGILCWVTDDITEENDFPQIIIKFKETSTSTTFISKGGMPWKYATPVTQEEVNKLIYKP